MLTEEGLYDYLSRLEEGDCKVFINIGVIHDVITLIPLKEFITSLAYQADAYTLGFKILIQPKDSVKHISTWVKIVESIERKAKISHGEKTRVSNSIQGDVATFAISPQQR